jgi:hypothetical protein
MLSIKNSKVVGSMSVDLLYENNEFHNNMKIPDVLAIKCTEL